LGPRKGTCPRLENGGFGGTLGGGKEREKEKAGLRWGHWASEAFSCFLVLHLEKDLREIRNLEEEGGGVKQGRGVSGKNPKKSKVRSNSVPPPWNEVGVPSKIGTAGGKKKKKTGKKKNKKNKTKKKKGQELSSEEIGDTKAPSTRRSRKKKHTGGKPQKAKEKKKKKVPQKFGGGGVFSLAQSGGFPGGGRSICQQGRGAPE